MTGLDDVRNARPREVKARTIPQRRGLRLLERGMLEFPLRDHGRPKTRGECAIVPRPCPFVSCAMNLYLDVAATGSLKLNMPELEPSDMRVSCALDAAGRGGHRLEEVGALMNMTRERIRQVERVALVKLAVAAAHLRDAVTPVGLREE
jgi:hypothetical protein